MTSEHGTHHTTEYPRTPRLPFPAATSSGSRQVTSRTPPAPLPRPGSARSLTRPAARQDIGSYRANTASAWSVDANSNGTVTITVRQLTHAAHLERALAQAGCFVGQVSIGLPPKMCRDWGVTSFACRRWASTCCRRTVAGIRPPSSSCGSGCGWVAGAVRLRRVDQRDRAGPAGRRRCIGTGLELLVVEGKDGGRRTGGNGHKPGSGIEAADPFGASL